MKNKLSCPRCGSRRIIEYENSYECPNCMLEFKKEDKSDIEEKNLLAIGEIKGILDELGGSESPKKLKKIEKSLKDD